MSVAISESQLEVIKNLIETCRNEQAGYLIAAEHARNAELRAFFSNQSMERARFAAELEGAARRGGTQLIRSSGIVDRINRAWVELKQRLSAGDAGVLDSVENGERDARNQYRQAVSAELPPEVQAIVERQSESISAAYDQVCALREMGGKAA
jgi:uncharacterized protein (TIGR02284 family)